MADFSAYKIPQGAPAGTWHDEYWAFVDAAEATLTEVEVARGGQANLDARLDPLDASSAEVTTARSSAAFGAYGSLDLRLEAIENRQVRAVSPGEDIQAAIQAVYDAGGGTVFIRKGTHTITNQLLLRPGVNLIGEGYDSYIYNSKTDTTFDEQVLLVGQMGAVGANGIPGKETWYDVNDVKAGDRIITFVTTANAGNFAAGNMVFLRDPNNDGIFYQNLNMNEVVAVDTGAGTITLRYRIPDNYVTFSATKPSICKLTTATPLFDPPGQSMWDAEKAYIAKNQIVANLRMETAQKNLHAVITASTWHCTFENLWLDGQISFGGNAVTRTVFRNIYTKWSLGDFNLGQWSHDVIVDNWNSYRRPGQTSNNASAFLIESSSGDMLFKDSTITTYKSGTSVGHNISVIAKRVKIVDCQLLGDGGGDVIILDTNLPSRECEVRNCLIARSNGTGIFVGGYDHLIIGNRIRKARSDITGFSSYAIRVNTDGRNMVVNNRVGQNGEALNSDLDIVIDFNGSNNSNRYVGNLSQMAQRHQTYPSVDHTGTLTETTVATYTIPVGSVWIRSAWRFHASGSVGGTAGQKDIRLKINGTTTAAVTYAAAESGTFWIDLTLNSKGTLNNQSAFWKIVKDTGAPDGAINTAANNALGIDTTTTAITVTLTAQLANTADLIEIGTWEAGPAGASDQVRY